MSGYREQQTRQGGRSGRRSLPSRGNASVHSVTPSAMDRPGRSRQSGQPFASQRLSVQPPVCGVQPGRVLELRTTLGLMRARAMLEQQIEQEQQTMDEGPQGGEKTGQRLKHGRLKPLGVISDPLMGSNSCLGIVSVNSRSLNHQRPRSSTTPETQLSNSAPVSDNLHDTKVLGKKAKIRQRSYSAMLPHNVTVDQMKELTANLSITKQTGLIPEEGTSTTDATSESRRTAHTIELSTNTDEKHPQTDISRDQHNNSQLDEKGAQKLINSAEYDLETVDGKVQILPPVVRQGELGMKIEVKRLRMLNNSVISETTSTDVVADKKQEPGKTVVAAIDSRTVKRLPKLQETKKEQAETSSHFSSQSPETNERLRDGPSDRALHDTTSSSSPRKVSIVSLGETPPSSKSQQTRQRQQQHRRKRRHSSSEGKQVGSLSRLSQGWSPPQLETIEPIVGSPLHTPRRRSKTAGAGEISQYAVRGPREPEGSAADLEALRSQMTSPGMFISVDVNEFLQDIEAENPA